MERTEEAFIISLLDKDPELRRYYEEHRELEKKLLSYQYKTYLTPAEEMEKKRLQKLKLVGKDRIMQILGKYRHREGERGTQ